MGAREGRSMNRWALFLVIAIGLSLFPLQVVQSASTSTATLSVSPASIRATEGQNFTISVTVSNVLDLYGWEFRLNWTTTLVDEVNVVEGPFLKTGGTTFFTVNVNATAGSMIVDCTLTGPVPGVNGNGTLATVTFYAKNVGTSPLNLYGVILVNSSVQEIPSQATGGYAYVTYAHDLAVTAVNFSPTALLPGGLVHINATVENLGGYSETFNVTAYANSQSIGEKKGVSLVNGSSTNIAFVWNTTGYGFGDYTISVSASVVPGETNTANNIKEAKNTLTILYHGHEIAVIGVKPFEPVLGQGLCMFITVTVKNYGIFNETFATTVYANKTAVQTQQVSLQSAKSAVPTFIWNTTNFAKGKYTISAYATPVPGETYLGDNNCTDGWVEVRLRGDVNGDGRVTLADVGLLDLIFSEVYPYTCPPYDVNNMTTYYYNTNPATGKVEHLMPDINGDGIVSLADVGLLDLIYSDII
jgi:hypothetical protein